MAREPRILVFAGSIRASSFNGHLARHAANHAKAAGAQVTLISLADHPLPIYNGNIEAETGVPTEARRLRKLFMAQDGFLIASPEYNSSVSPLLKNTIDWVSRPDEGDPMVVAYRGKVAGLVAASPGALGGLRGLVHLRAILGNIGVYLVPQQHVIGNAAAAFDENGALVREGDSAAIQGVAQAVVRLAAANRN